jgi:hypothetical protein
VKQSQPEFDYREAFREQFRTARTEDGKRPLYAQQTRALLTAISGYVQPATGDFYMSEKMAASILGTGERWARRKLKQLCDLGLIEVVRRGGGRGGRATDYHVCITIPGHDDPVFQSEIQGHGGTNTGSVRAEYRVIVTPTSSSTKSHVVELRKSGAARFGKPPRSAPEVVGILVEWRSPHDGGSASMLDVHMPAEWRDDFDTHLTSLADDGMTGLVRDTRTDDGWHLRIHNRAIDEWRQAVHEWLADRNGGAVATDKRALAAMKRKAG